MTPVVFWLAPFTIVKRQAPRIISALFNASINATLDSKGLFKRVVKSAFIIRINVLYGVPWFGGQSMIRL